MSSSTVIALVSQKGGTGKTTVALTLGVCARQAGKTVLMLDLDPQGNLSAWGKKREDGRLLTFSTHIAALPQLLEQAKEQKVDWVILDTAAGTDTSAAAAVAVAGLVLIACRPSQFDLEAIANTVRLCLLRKVTPQVVLTQLDLQGTMQREARQRLSELGVSVLPGGLSARAAFRHSVLSSQAVTEYEPRGKAATEARDLYRVVKTRVLSQPRKKASAK